jgi:hypothetical protein
MGELAVSVVAAPAAAHVPTEHDWLLSRTGDFWLVCAGGGALLVAMALLLHWHGDRELDLADLLLSELHLGATWGAIVSGRMWRSMRVDVLVVPMLILVLVYLLAFGDYWIVLASAALYFAAWHRARQNFGIARYYQARVGGPVSALHCRLFTIAIYAPMVAGVLYFTGTAPLYEEEEYFGLELDPNVLFALGALAAASVAAYLAFAWRHRARIHPGERWLVVAQALAFGSAYVLGAWSVSFVLVLAVHHEVQYLCFTYAMARRRKRSGTNGVGMEIRRLASFALWPLIGIGSWALCQQSESEWVPPFLIGGLFCHYWLDGRIWTSRARRLVGAAS